MSEGQLRVTVEGPEALIMDLPRATEPEPVAAEGAEGQSVAAGPAGARSGPEGISTARGASLMALTQSATDSAEGRRRYEVIVDGWRFEVAAEPARQAELRDRARRAAAQHAVHPRTPVRAQIPGRIVAVHVAAGESVEAGQALLSIEAMKMENEVRATRAGTIERVGVAAGARVELGDELVVIG